MSKDKVDSIKEYMIRLMKRQLFFEEFFALKDVSLNIEKGDVFGIVGLNGSGKSTLLKVISGILKPSKGRVRTYGTISPMIELGAGFDMDLTARENVFLNGSVLGYSRKQMREKFDEIIEFAELKDFVDVAVRGFAIATITKPEILIVDEILAVGDFLFQEKCENRIRELMDGGTTVLIVSHAIEQIERLCKHVLWLDHGHMKMLGDTKTVCDAYKQIN